MRFLERFSQERRDKLIARGALERFARGEAVVTYQDETRDVYIVQTGEARATIYSTEGKAVAYRDLLAGDVFGELAAIDGSVRSASVIAIGELAAIRYSARLFDEMIADDPIFCRALMAHLTQELRKATARIFEFSTMPVRDRLVAELLRALREADGGEISPAPTHQELAERISSHREAVSREMSALAKVGLVRKVNGALRIADAKALSAKLSEDTLKIL